MKTKRLLAVLLTGVMILGASACNGNGKGNTLGDSGTSSGTSADSNENIVTTPPEVNGGDFISQNPDDFDDVGEVKWLGYYDLATNDTKMVDLFEQRYGGKITSEVCSSGDAYFDALGTKISSDLSPDIVRYEWRSFPHGMYKNMYLGLDGYIDIDSDLWSGMSTTIEQFCYGGYHYYLPYKVTTNFALNYNRSVLEEAGMDDPMDLYLDGDWTWTTFKDMLVEWCDKDENHIGYTGVGGMSFISTTGVVTIDVTPEGEILNNLKDQNVQRCMEFVEGLYKEKLIGKGYVDPAEAFLDGNLLFLGMEPSWAHSTAQEALTKQNITNDMAFIPFPRDDNSDTYSIAYDTFGYLIPSGAKNIEGAVCWINLNRIEETDEENIAEAKDNAISTDPTYYPKCSECGYRFTEDEATLATCPECSAARREKFKEVYTEEQWDIFQDMKNPEKFNLVYDDCFGFNADMTALFQGGSAESPSLLDSPVFHGASFTTVRDSLYNTVESYLEPYRTKLAEDTAKNNS